MDSTAIHPESYPAVASLRHLSQARSEAEGRKPGYIFVMMPQHFTVRPTVAVGSRFRVMIWMRAGAGICSPA